MRLCGDELPAKDGSTLALLRSIADQAGERVPWGAECSDIVGVVVLVAAALGNRTARDGSGAGGLAERIQHLDTLGVIRVDNRADVEISGICEAVEAYLAEYAGNILSTIVDGVKVANPALREDLLLSSASLESQGIDAFEPGVGGELDSPSGAVLVDKLDKVLSRSQSCKRGGCEKNGIQELHLGY